MIIKNSNGKVCSFKDIPTGGVFKHTNIYYIKIWTIEDEDGEAWNAIILTDGMYGTFSANTEVIPCPNAYLMIE